MNLTNGFFKIVGQGRKYSKVVKNFKVFKVINDFKVSLLTEWRTPDGDALALTGISQNNIAFLH